MTHYSKGSEKPALNKDCLRLYSMRFCPFAQRARLVLAAKGVEYECVNINLKDKPEWFFDLNPVGKVPVIEHPDGKVIYESAICCDYLEDLFPEKALYPKDPYGKYKQRVLVETLGSAIVGAYTKSLIQNSEEVQEELKKQLAAFDKYLKDNKKHIGGENPGMGDFLIWPWFERLLVTQSRVGVDLSQYSAVSAWVASMSEVPAVKECRLPAELHVKFGQGYRAGDANAQLIGAD